MFLPYKAKYPNSKYDVCELFDYEATKELSYVNLCYNEAMRIEAPGALTTSFVFTEDTYIMDKKYKIRKDDSFLICIHEI